MMNSEAIAVAIFTLAVVLAFGGVGIYTYLSDKPKNLNDRLLEISRKEKELIRLKGVYNREKLKVERNEKKYININNNP